MKYLLIILTILLTLGCGHSTPLTPELGPEFKTVSFWDDLQPDGWEPDGTGMYNEEITIYFAAHYTEATWMPDSPNYCKMYLWWYKIFSDNYLCALLVREYERYNCDIPNERDIEPPC